MICEDYLTGAHSMDVPQETLDKEVQAILDKIKSKPDFNPNQLFDPEKHLAWKDEYFENTKTFTLQDLGITKTHTKPINNFGATYPFPLLTEEAIDIMKWEAFQPQIVKKYARLTNPDFSLKTNRHDFHIAGYPEEGHAPFTKSVYEHPRLKEIFSQLIGMDVTTTYGYDVNHVNVALADFDMPLDAPLYPEPEKDEDGKPIFKAEEVGSILGQHYDSTSIACVIMWECPQDKGGETVIITGDETPLVIPNIARPGYCTLLQARVIRHIATKPNTNSNRIATVAGYYPTAPILDNSCLTSVRPSILPRSVHDQFYTEWFDFRFKQLERVLADKRKKLWDAYKKGETFDQKDVIEFSKECQQYLFDSWREMEFANNDPYPPPLFSKPYSELTYEVGADNTPFFIMSVRPATHAGSWYTGSALRLELQLDKWLSKASGPVAGARLLVGPHAGYAYAGETLAQTYSALDASEIKRVFIMGPSHHVYFRGCVMTSNFDYYETPLGNVPVDKQTIKDLVAKDPKMFRLMSEEMDEEEHSFEMHMPYLYRVTSKARGSIPQIIPIMISATDEKFERKLAEHLTPYFQDHENAFVISTDFCHWGSRFGYTLYTPSGKIADIQDLRYGTSVLKKSDALPIYKSIEALDKEAMKIASKTSYKAFRDYLAATENTICGAKPLSVLLLLMEQNSDKKLEWLGYKQSSSVTSAHDSSVSYASAYA